MKPLGRTGNYMTERRITREWLSCVGCGGKGTVLHINEQTDIEERITCPVCLGEKGYEVER